MRRGLLLFFGMICGAGLMFLAVQYHIVRAEQEWVLIAKEQTSLDYIYADIRGWTYREWQENPVLASAIAAGGRADLIRRSTSEGVLRDFLQWMKDRTSSQSLEVPHVVPR